MPEAAPVMTAVRSASCITDIYHVTLSLPIPTSHGKTNADYWHAR